MQDLDVSWSVRPSAPHSVAEAVARYSRFRAGSTRIFGLVQALVQGQPAPTAGRADGFAAIAPRLAVSARLTGQGNLAATRGVSGVGRHVAAQGLSTIRAALLDRAGSWCLLSAGFRSQWEACPETSGLSIPAVPQLVNWRDKGQMGLSVQQLHYSMIWGPAA